MIAAVKAVEMHHDGLSDNLSRDNVGFSVRKVSLKDICCGNIASDSRNNRPIGVAGFSTLVILPD